MTAHHWGALYIPFPQMEVLNGFIANSDQYLTEIPFTMLI